MCRTIRHRMLLFGDFPQGDDFYHSSLFAPSIITCKWQFFSASILMFLFSSCAVSLFGSSYLGRASGVAQVSIDFICCFLLVFVALCAFFCPCLIVFVSPLIFPCLDLPFLLFLVIVSSALLVFPFLLLLLLFFYILLRILNCSCSCEGRE